MTPLPPPAPIDEPTATSPHRSRRRLALAAVAATAIGLAGVVAGSQLAGADDENDPPPADDTIDGQPIDEDDPIDDDAVDEPADEDDQADDDAEDSDSDSDEWNLPELDELKTAFEDFENCIADQLPDLKDGGWIDIEDGELPDIGDWDQEFEDLLGGSVTVFSPGAEDGDLTLLDFGDGDGTVTITQTDGEITISTDGDVDIVDTALPSLPDLDLPDLGFELDPEVDAAFESCASLLPGDGIFDMVGDLVGEFGDFGGDDGIEQD